MKDQTNDKSPQITDSKSSTKPVQNNQKSTNESLTDTKRQPGKDGLSDEHPLKNSTTDDKKMSDRTVAEHDVKAKDKTPGASTLQKEGTFEKPKTK